MGLVFHKAEWKLDHQLLQTPLKNLPTTILRSSDPITPVDIQPALKLEKLFATGEAYHHLKKRKSELVQTEACSSLSSPLQGFGLG